VQTIDMSGQLPLIMPYLQHVQRENNKVVNEAINNLLVEEENYEALRESIHDYDNFDQIQLALALQRHERLEFRRIAAQLYRRNQRWPSSLDLSKQDKLWQDAMETVAASGDKGLAEELLRFFVSREDCPKSCFAACLYTCYPLIHPDVVLELSWRHNLMEFCMPFMVQTFRAMSTKMDSLTSKVEKTEIQAQEQKEKEQKQENEKIEQSAGLLTATPLMIGYVPESQYAQTASQMFGGGGAAPNYTPAINPYGVGVGGVSGVGVGGIGGARPWG
jgi:clathrin heavy chain